MVHHEASDNAPPAQMLTALPADDWPATNWYKQTVYDLAGNKLGELADWLVDHDGKNTAVLIGVGGLLGVGEKYVAVPFDAIHFKPEDEVFLRDALGLPPIDIKLLKTEFDQAQQVKKAAADALPLPRQLGRAGQLPDPGLRARAGGRRRPHLDLQAARRGRLAVRLGELRRRSRRSISPTELPGFADGPQGLRRRAHGSARTAALRR